MKKLFVGYLNYDGNKFGEKDLAKSSEIIFSAMMGDVRYNKAYFL
jgi:hypothetical protein